MSDTAAINTGTAAANEACVGLVNQNNGSPGAKVTSSEFSQAGSLVMLTDAKGTTWRCLASNDGVVEELTAS